MTNWIQTHPGCREFGHGLKGAYWLRKRRPTPAYIAQMVVELWFGPFTVTPRIHHVQ